MSEERIPIGGAKTRCKKCNTEIIIKSKADKIYYDIKNGATAKQIIKKHSISLDELKSLVISFRQKGLLKKAGSAEPQSRGSLDRKMNVKTDVTNEHNNIEITAGTNQHENSMPDKETKKDGEETIELSEVWKVLKARLSSNGIRIDKNLLRIENLCALCLILFFFFSWINIGGFISVSGYGIPDGVKAIAQWDAVLEEQKGVNPSVHLYYLLYLIPISSIVTIVFSLMGKDNKIPGFIAAALPIVFFFIAIFKAGTNLFDVLAIGFYLTIITSTVMMLYLIKTTKIQILLAAKN
jgi:hypothetical protein